MCVNDCLGYKWNHLLSGMSFLALMYARSFIPLATLFVALVLFFTRTFSLSLSLSFVLFLFLSLPLSPRSPPCAVEECREVLGGIKFPWDVAEQRRKSSERFVLRRILLCLLSNVYRRQVCSPLSSADGIESLFYALVEWSLKRDDYKHSLFLVSNRPSWDFANLIRSGFISAQPNFPNAFRRANGFTRN